MDIFDLYDLTIMIGMATYAMLLFTFLIGFRIIKLHFKWHRLFAIITLLLATVHGSLFLYMKYC